MIQAQFPVGGDGLIVALLISIWRSLPPAQTVRRGRVWYNHAVCEKFSAGSLFRDAAVLEHHDAAERMNGGEAMSNEEWCGPA